MRRGHYAWLVCLGGMLSLCMTMGLGVNVFSIYQSEIIELNHFTNAQGSWITTIRTLFILGTLLLINQLCDKLGLRLVMPLGMVLVGVGRFCFGLSSSFWMYCASAALTGIGYCMGGMVPLALIISRWFDSRRSLALGIASAGSGISTLIAPPVLTRLMTTHGLRAAFFCEGAVILLGAAAGWLLLRSSPADMGLEPYRLENDPAPAVQRDSEGYGPVPVLFLMLAAFLLGAPNGPGFSHLAILFTTEGYDPMTVAGLISYMGVTICVGKVLFGQLYDRLGSWISNILILGINLAGLALCCLAFTKRLSIAFLALTAFGLGLAITAVCPSVWARDLARSTGFPKIVRAFTAVNSFGMLLFGPIPGILADRFGSYVPAYALFLGTMILVTLIIQLLYLRLGLNKRPV